MCTCTRYIVGFIGDDESKRDWIKNHTLILEQNIHMIIKMVGKYPQEIHAAAVRAIESEWIFLKFLTSNMEYALTVVKKLL